MWLGFTFYKTTSDCQTNNFFQVYSGQVLNENKKNCFTKNHPELPANQAHCDIALILYSNMLTMKSSSVTSKAVA